MSNIPVSRATGLALAFAQAQDVAAVAAAGLAPNPQRLSRVLHSGCIR